MVHRDHATQTALRCARAAELEPAYDGLEHPRGMFAAMGGSSDDMLAPGDAPAIATVSFRRHQTSGFCQAAVEAAQLLAPVSPDVTVTLQVPEATAALAAIAAPQTEEEAWWSVQHAVAATLLGRDLADCPVDDPIVTGVRDRITLTVGDASRVQIGGEVAERAAAAPLTDEDLLAKWDVLNPGLPGPTELLS